MPRSSRQAGLARARDPGWPRGTAPVWGWSCGSVPWLYGAPQVLVLSTAEDAPQYVQALQEQMDTAQAILQGQVIAVSTLPCCGCAMCWT